jgi:hypothetical protein
MVHAHWRFSALAVTYGMEIWAPSVPRQQDRADTCTAAFGSTLKDLEALLFHCTPSMATWQDCACTASAILCRDMATVCFAHSCKH